MHPLGKAPVLEDGETVLAESGAIVDYVIRVHGAGRMRPAPGKAEHEHYLEWLHYAEGSAMTPFVLKLYAGRLGDAAAPILPRIDSEIANHLGYLERALSGRDWLLGGADPSGADVMMSFVGEIARKSADMIRLPNVAAWVGRFQARPAYSRALKRGGKYAYA